MNCFSISVYVSNPIFRGNHNVFGVFFTPAPVIVVLYYMLILTHQQHILVDSAILFILLQISSSFDYIRHDQYLSTYFLQLPQSNYFS